MSIFTPKIENMAATRDEGWRRASPVYGTTAGEPVSESTALNHSAVWSATRIISETLGSFPLHLMQQTGERERERATGHSLYTIMHSEPNPEQDSMVWFDQQVPAQLNWGDCFAEIQRRSGGEVYAIWPIHPSRIPIENIRRNSSRRRDQLEVGRPGELVYYVKNDDGSETGIRARDMLHVPGVLTPNGITGRGVVQWGAASIGINLATDKHAGSYFNNGASSHIALRHPRKLSQEKAGELRMQWQEVYGGASNKYKTIVLEDGMEIETLSFNPEQSQLLGSRQFGVNEIARWYRLPPHMLADLTRSTFSNIESENLSFVIHSMMPWVTRWERALNRQLLTEEEKRQGYYFRFNVNGLLRGDMKSRAEFYGKLFDLGALSSNDIRAFEDQNPIEGGDQYFVPLNLGSLSGSDSRENSDDTPSDPPQDTGPTNAARLTLKGLLRAAAQGIIGYECVNLKHAAARPQAFIKRYESFYENKFPAVFRQFTQPFKDMLAEAGVNIDWEERQAMHVQDTIALLEPVLSGPMNELETKLAETVEAWQWRCDHIAEQICNEVQNG